MLRSFISVKSKTATCIWQNQQRKIITKIKIMLAEDILWNTDSKIFLRFPDISSFYFSICVTFSKLILKKLYWIQLLAIETNEKCILHALQSQEKESCLTWFIFK